MALKQWTPCQISQSIKSLIIILLCLFVFMPITQVFAEPTNYGPTKNGDTLWNIAQKNLPNQSLSVEQFVYSIYTTNPNAFQSSNINRLLKGVTLVMPDADTSMKISKAEAKKRITILQADAKQIARAKINNRKFNKQIKKYSRQLRKYRRNSRAWRRVYRKLARSKRNLAVSKRKVARLKQSLHDKSNLKLASSAKSNEKMVLSNPIERTEISQKEIDETNKVLSKLAIKEQNKNQDIQVASIKKEKTESKANNKSKQSSEPENKENQNAEAIKAVGVATKVTAKEVGATKQAAIPDIKQIETNEIKKATASSPNTSFKPVSSLSSSSSPSSQAKINWLDYISENFILIAGIINGIILIFVLIKLFEKKEEPDFIHE